MKRLPVALVLALLVVAAVLGATLGTSAAPDAGPSATVAPVTSAALVCPALDGVPDTTSTRLGVLNAGSLLTPPVSSSGRVAATVLAGSKSSTHALAPLPGAQLVSTRGKHQTVAVQAAGSVAASLGADQVIETPLGRYRGLAGVRCEAPGTDWWFAGADGRVGFADRLFVANPSAVSATISISLWGSTGPVRTSRLEAIRVAARGSVQIPIATIAPDVATVAVHLHALSGVVTAALLDRRTSALVSEGGDFIPPSVAPSTASVVAGYVGGAGSRTVVLANPGPIEATVSLRVIGPTGAFVPTGDTQLAVRPGHTRTVNVQPALRASPGAIVVTSDQPIVASGRAVAPAAAPKKRPDLFWLASTPPLVRPAPIADGRQMDGGSTVLVVSAPVGAAQVRVTAASGRQRRISVPAGHTVAVTVTGLVRRSSGLWPFVVSPVGPNPVYGVRVLRFAGAHGQLITAEPLIGLPRPLLLPPVREDPTVAVRP